MTEVLVSQQKQLIINLQDIINYAEENNLTNTQEFLDFLDKLNEISVSY